MMRIWNSLIVIFFISHGLSQEIISAVDFYVNDNNEMIISYSFNPENNSEKYKIKISVTDNGTDWFSPKSVEGDIGIVKESGSKTVTWDIFSDLDELEGDIVVDVSAKLSRSLRKILTTPSKSKTEKLEGLYANLYMPFIEFDNPTFKGRINSGTLIEGPKGGFSFGIILPPHIVDFQMEQSNYATTVEMPYFNYNDGLEYAIFDTNDLVHKSFAFSLSQTILPFLPIITPSVGVGAQSSGLFYNANGNPGGYGYMNHSVLRTSDLFILSSLHMVRGPIFLQLSYKKSLIRKMRNWSVYQLFVGWHIGNWTSNILGIPIPILGR